jgi:hypothetical protein
LSLRVRFLTVIPTTKPDIKLDFASSKLPFVDAIATQPNRLKACLVVGKDMGIGLYLFKKYQPCSDGMWTVMQLADTARDLSNSYCIWVCMHPYTSMPTSSRDSPIEVNGDIKALIVEGARIIPHAKDIMIPSFLGIELALPPTSIPSYYFKALVAEMFALVRPATQAYMGGPNLEGREIADLPPMSIRLDFYGATVSEAMIAGEAVSEENTFHAITRG